MKSYEELEKERDYFKENFEKSVIEIEELNKKLISSEEYKSKFLSLIRNEFNNPISSILNLSKNLVKKAPNDKMKFLSECINRESFILRFQIANIIAAAELEAGLFNEEKTNIKIHSLITQSKEFLDYLIVEKNPEINESIKCYKCSIKSNSRSTKCFSSK